MPLLRTGLASELTCASIGVDSLRSIRWEPFRLGGSRSPMTPLWLEVPMALLAFASVWLAFQPDTDSNHWMSLGINAVFVVEYGIRLLRSSGRGKFVRANIPDFIAILPWDILRGARLIRLVRVLRLVRGLEVLWRIGRQVSGVLKTNGLAYALMSAAVLVVGGGLAVCQVEPGMGTSLDGIWWGLVTATTVGYGDISPKTLEGRIIAGILMLVGIGVLGMVSGSIATYFLGSRGSSNPHVQHVQKQLDRWEHMSSDERREVVRVLGALDRDAPTERLP